MALPPQKIRQELLSRQGSVDATLDSVSKLLKSADASTASGLQGALQDLIQRYTAAQAKQNERETELRGLLPKLESFERQSADLRSFTQRRERALSPVGQPDCSVDDYRQTIEVIELCFWHLWPQIYILSERLHVYWDGPHCRTQDPGGMVGSRSNSSHLTYT